jgi:hypothetical protein
MDVVHLRRMSGADARDAQLAHLVVTLKHESPGLAPCPRAASRPCPAHLSVIQCERRDVLLPLPGRFARDVAVGDGPASATHGDVGVTPVAIRSAHPPTALDHGVQIDPVPFFDVERSGAVGGEVERWAGAAVLDSLGSVEGAAFEAEFCSSCSGWCCSSCSGWCRHRTTLSHSALPMQARRHCQHGTGRPSPRGDATAATAERYSRPPRPWTDATVRQHSGPAPRTARRAGTARD